MSSEPFSVPGIEHTFEGNTERIVWHNSQLPRNTVLYILHIVGFLIFLPLTIFLAYQLIQTQFGPNTVQIDWTSIVISAFSILLFGFIVYITGSKLLSLSWREEIFIGENQISLRTQGPFAKKDRDIPVSDIWRLSFEKYKHNQDQDFRYSLNIFHKRREQIGYWLRQDDGQQLYQLLVSVIERRGWAGLIVTEEKGYEPRSRTL